MTEADEIRMPDEPARLLQHAPVDVLITLRTAQGESKPVLGGRCSTPHVRPNGLIAVVKPPFDAGRVPPLKRAEAVHVRLKRSREELLEADGVVSWVRPKAFLPSGQSVTLVGITFEWDPEEHVLEVAAFLSRASVPPSG
ncbi:MAG TPA: hypothetical protein VHE30_15735 [Polyangiaceae bacterium]|nr:hypothetical protein [Polyangiaceae bacterium]